MAASKDLNSNAMHPKKLISAAKVPKGTRINNKKHREDISGIKIAGIRSPVGERDFLSKGSLTYRPTASGKRRDEFPNILKDRSPRMDNDGMESQREEVFETKEACESLHSIEGKGKGKMVQTSVVNEQRKSSPRKNASKKAVVASSTRSVMPMHEYTIKPIIPAKTAELLDVARAMHRDQFATRVKKLFDPEREAAMEAIESGVYIGWRCLGNDFDCIRVSLESRCFCGHALSSHDSYQETGKEKLKCLSGGCSCKQFAFIPSRPEEIGEWWLQKRRGFDVTSWRAKCRCKHDHEQHNPNSNRKCKIKSCSCFAFDSNFLCAACDKHWEEHETCFDVLASRQQKGLPYGEEYLPFHELPQLRNIVLTGNEDDNSKYDALTSGPYAIPRQRPTQLALQLQGKRS